MRWWNFFMRVMNWMIRWCSKIILPYVDLLLILVLAVEICNFTKTFVIHSICIWIVWRHDLTRISRIISYFIRTRNAITSSFKSLNFSSRSRIRLLHSIKSSISLCFFLLTILLEFFHSKVSWLGRICINNWHIPFVPVIIILLLHSWV